MRSTAFVGALRVWTLQWPEPAKRWTKNGYDRLYINIDMVEAACEKYNEGVVPMNRRAKGNFKMWVEVETGEIKSQGMGNYADDIERWVAQYIEEA